MGISQISAGSRTDPGGYKDGEGDPNGSQFQLGDHRSVEEVVTDVVSLGYTPSFCTACYRLRRTGQDFMDLAKPGEIKYHCHPNALSTFLEYLCDYAGPVAKSAGEKLISIELQQMDNQQTACTLPMLNQVQDITKPIFQKEQIIERARDVIQKNLKTVQQIAYLLGENAAESEITLDSIVRSFSPEEIRESRKSSK